MGKQAHIQTKRIVSRVNIPLFNNDCHIIEEFLVENGCLTTYVQDDDYIDYLPTWEIDKDKLQWVMQKLKKEDQNKKLAGEYTAKDLVKIFQSWIELTDNKENFSDNDYIYIDWY